MNHPSPSMCPAASRWPQTLGPFASEAPPTALADRLGDTKRDRAPELCHVDFFGGLNPWGSQIRASRTNSNLTSKRAQLPRNIPQLACWRHFGLLPGLPHESSPLTAVFEGDFQVALWWPCCWFHAVSLLSSKLLYRLAKSKKKVFDLQPCSDQHKNLFNSTVVRAWFFTFSKQDTVAVHFSHVFSLFSSKQSPYMHPSAELYIPVSDVHPPLARQITLFSLLRGIKNLEKTKKTKKNKMTEPMSQYPEPRKTKKNKKTKWQNPCPSIQNLEKPKKTKRQNLCPSIWHGVSTFGFFGFFGFSR